MDKIGHPKTKWRDLRFKIVATVFIKNASLRMRIKNISCRS